MLKHYVLRVSVCKYSYPIVCTAFHTNCTHTSYSALFVSNHLLFWCCLFCCYFVALVVSNYLLFCRLLFHQLLRFLELSVVQRFQDGSQNILNVILLELLVSQSVSRHFQVLLSIHFDDHLCACLRVNAFLLSCDHLIACLVLYYVWAIEVMLFEAF